MGSDLCQHPQADEYKTALGNRGARMSSLEPSEGSNSANAPHFVGTSAPEQQWFGSSNSSPNQVAKGERGVMRKGGHEGAREFMREEGREAGRQGGWALAHATILPSASTT